MSSPDRSEPGYFIVDRRDRVSVRVTDDAADPIDPRYVKVWADSVDDAFRRACVTSQPNDHKR